MPPLKNIIKYLLALDAVAENDYNSIHIWPSGTIDLLSGLSQVSSTVQRKGLLNYLVLIFDLKKLGFGARIGPKLNLIVATATKPLAKIDCLFQMVGRNV